MGCPITPYQQVLRMSYDGMSFALYKEPLQSFAAYLCYGAFTHVSVGGREVQNQNLQKCMKVGLKWLAEVGSRPPWWIRSYIPLSPRGFSAVARGLPAAAGGLAASWISKFQSVSQPRIASIERARIMHCMHGDLKACMQI